MKNKELIAKLSKLDLEAEVHTRHSSSGASSEATSVYEHCVKGNESSGPISALPEGTKVIIISING